MAGLVPASPITLARPCHMIGVAGTSPAMTVDLFDGGVSMEAWAQERQHNHHAAMNSFHFLMR